MICYHPFPIPYYMWDAVNMQTQKVSKVPLFDDISKWLHIQEKTNNISVYVAHVWYQRDWAPWLIPKLMYPGKRKSDLSNNDIFEVCLEYCSLHTRRVRIKWWLISVMQRCISWPDQGAVSIRKTVLPGMAIPMLKIRRPNGRLIFNMEIAIRR